jgi:hypothetical protein
VAGSRTIRGRRSLSVTNIARAMSSDCMRKPGVKGSGGRGPRAVHRC